MPLKSIIFELKWIPTAITTATTTTDMDSINVMNKIKRRQILSVQRSGKGKRRHFYFSSPTEYKQCAVKGNVFVTAHNRTRTISIKKSLIGWSWWRWWKIKSPARLSIVKIDKFYIAFVFFNWMKMDIVIWHSMKME